MQENVCETPELKDGFYFEIYVDGNIIEVFVNNGEYMISNVVYDVTDEIICNKNAEMLVFANTAAAIVTTRKGALKVMLGRDEIYKFAEIGR